MADLHALADAIRRVTTTTDEPIASRQLLAESTVDPEAFVRLASATRSFLEDCAGNASGEEDRNILGRHGSVAAEFADIARLLQDEGLISTHPSHGWPVPAPPNVEAVPAPYITGQSGERVVEADGRVWEYVDHEWRHVGDDHFEIRRQNRSVPAADKALAMASNSPDESEPSTRDVHDLAVFVAYDDVALLEAGIILSAKGLKESDASERQSYALALKVLRSATVLCRSTHSARR